MSTISNPGPPRWSAGTERPAEPHVRHFLDDWVGRPSIFEEDLDAWVDNFMKPGNLQGGFNWYVGIDEARTELWRHGAPKLPKIGVPARFFWGEEDPLVKIEWADRLGEYFSDYSFFAAERRVGKECRSRWSP